MTVDKTSGIIHNLPGTIAGNKNIKRPEDVYKAASGASEDTHTLKVGDKVEISNEARDLQKKLSDLKAEIKMMPDTREEKLKNVKARIESGFYDRDAVIKEVARSIKDSGQL
ncbi:MAG: flagellar biosynthesis anti-sigma factor FlgM [Candidatus Scalindua sp.]|jgi:anti-sigma28 factor (negative regulator of flagellin synthesis)|nr:flagellar biosynthesis anti-sigma factor FlgM [Candidatus Scalindua sp.]MBT6229365.1 flagellar biosynthesis anti-sigma factor FlgM [Candidatus Scalindua sp.]MBT6560986.1 flagellar biosynthesis anti-sigma factor FlgM [Candidatus Scalindua sp.]